MPRPSCKFVDQQPAAFLGDGAQRDFQLRPAIAAQAVKHVAGQALRVDAHQRRPVGDRSPICRATASSDAAVRVSLAKPWIRNSPNWVGKSASAAFFR